MSNEETTPTAEDVAAQPESAADATDSMEAPAQSPTDGAAEQAQGPSLEEQLTAAQRKAQENLEGWQRTLAEFQNYRRRMDRDLQESYQRASVDMLMKLLPIIDDFERGMADIPDEIKGSAWLGGIELIHRKFLKLLDDLEVAVIDPVGEPFDPSRHEAVGADEHAEAESGHVTVTLQKGYAYRERVLRPALVRVAG